MRAQIVKNLARECGFELSGIAPALPLAGEIRRYDAWVAQGFAGEMRYLADRRAQVRHDPRNLLPQARSVICAGKLYNQPAAPLWEDAALISRYAWGRDYHHVLREGLEALARKLDAIEAHTWKVCVDTAPLLERGYARQAGLGWIGRNTCLINEPLGSWFFLGELLTTLQLEAELEYDAPPPDRCGTCTRCIEACPTQAFVPHGGEWTLDARRCISYLNIELRGAIPEQHRPDMGPNIFGCDVCQEVCPWNARAPETADFAPLFETSPPLESLAYLTEEGFHARYRGTPVTRPKYEGFLRNVAVAMGASGSERYREPLEHLARHSSALVVEHARWALERIGKCAGVSQV